MLTIHAVRSFTACCTSCTAPHIPTTCLVSTAHDLWFVTSVIARATPRGLLANCKWPATRSAGGPVWVVGLLHRFLLGRWLATGYGHGILPGVPLRLPSALSRFSVCTRVISLVAGQTDGPSVRLGSLSYKCFSQFPVSSYHPRHTLWGFSLLALGYMFRTSFSAPPHHYLLLHCSSWAFSSPLLGLL